MSEENNNLESAAKALAEECLEVTYTTRWLSGSRSVSEDTKQLLIEGTGAKGNALSASKGLFRSDHPLLDALNAAKRNLEKWRDAFTLLKYAGIDKDDTGKPRAVPGVRLIRKANVEEFDAGFLERAAEVHNAAAKVQEHMRKPYTDKDGKEWKSILDNEQEKLKKEFDERDYPADVSKAVRIGDPSYSMNSIPVDLPPALQERMANSYRQAVEATLAGTVDGLVAEFREAAVALLDKVAFKTYCRAPGPYMDEELRNVLEVGGKVSFTVTTETTNGTRKRRVTESFGPMPKAEYTENWKPFTSRERNTIRNEAIDGLLARLADLRRVKDAVGPYGEAIDRSLDKLREVLQKVDSTDMFRAEVRSSSTYRKSIADAVTEAVSGLDAVRSSVAKGRVVDVDAQLLEAL